MIVGIDVGNTAVKIAIAGRPDSIIKRVSDPDAMQWVAQTLANLSLSDPADVRIASVNRANAIELIERTRAIAGEQIGVRQITHADLPIAIATDAPERVGIDRLVGAFGATKDYRLPLVLVDAGTTVTVDLIDASGVYRGGAIIPGLEMQTRALAAGTDALPQIDWQASCDCTNIVSTEIVPAQNTIAAMRLGILSSVIGGIERLIHLYGSPRRVVVTGGDCHCIASELQNSSHSTFETHLHPHLVCQTLANLEAIAKP